MQSSRRSVERINFAVVAVTATLFLAIAAFVALSTSKMMEDEAHSTVENVVKATVGRIDRQMASVESAVENSAWIVAEHVSDPDYMFRITGELVQNNPFIVGSTVAFEPNFFPSKGYYYSAFSCKDAKGEVKRIQQGGENFKYHGMDWYRIPKESRKSSWCEPYFDEGGAEFLAAKSNVVAGFMDGYAYAMQETTFEPGTMLLAYTDGVTEAERADHEQYGAKRLLAFASAHAKDAPASFVENLEKDLDAFTAGAEQSDDIAALAVLVDGAVESRHLTKG